MIIIFYRVRSKNKINSLELLCPTFMVLHNHLHQVSPDKTFIYTPIVHAASTFKSYIRLKIEFPIILRPLFIHPLSSVRLLGSFCGQPIYYDRPTTTVCLYNINILFVCLSFLSNCLSGNDFLGLACRL